MSTKAKMWRKSIARWISAGLLLLFYCSAAKASDVWFVDTRSGQPSLEQLDERNNRWISADMDEFLETGNAEIPMVVMIHGNLMTRSEARWHGMGFYRMAQGFGNFRLVIWSWPSSKQHCRVRPDARTKAIRADSQAAFLAAFLKETKLRRPDSKISLLGFSYGAKVACRALDLLARDPEFPVSENTPQVRVVLLAAAMDRHSLSHGQPYGNALSVTEKMLVHVNPEDKTLRYYPMLWKLHGPEAAGKEGVSIAGISAENRRKIKSVNVTGIIGEAHGFMSSLRGLLACRNDFRHFALFE